MVQLPAISAEQFEAEVERDELSRQEDNDGSDHDDKAPSQEILEEEASEDDFDDEDVDQDVQSISSSQCLFCNLISSDMDTNISHMHTMHGLFIPSPDQLLDLESFLGYLATIIFDYNTCLYCSAERGSVEGIQTHMRDKGHCMINLDAGSELLDFWGLEDSDEEGDDVVRKLAATKLSDSEMRLPSGAVINSRSDTTQLRAKPALAQSRKKGSQFRVKRNELRAIADANKEAEPRTSDSEPDRSQSRNSRQVAVRGEMGITGLSEAQKHALQVTEKKMKKRETVARAAQRWAMEKVANKQKYFKVCLVFPYRCKANKDTARCPRTEKRVMTQCIVYMYNTHRRKGRVAIITIFSEHLSPCSPICRCSFIINGSAEKYDHAG
jgi:pre-60S factor REI1